MTDVLAFLLLFLPVIDWTAVFVLGKVVARFPKVDTLRERLLIALGIAFLSTVFAILGLSRLGHIALPSDLVALAIFLVVSGLSAINLLFLIRYGGMAFRDDGGDA